MSRGLWRPSQLARSAAPLPASFTGCNCGERPLPRPQSRLPVSAALPARPVLAPSLRPPPRHRPRRQSQPQPRLARRAGTHRRSPAPHRRCLNRRDLVWRRHWRRRPVLRRPARRREPARRMLRQSLSLAPEAASRQRASAERPSRRRPRRIRSAAGLTRVMGPSSSVVAQRCAGQRRAGVAVAQAVSS